MQNTPILSKKNKYACTSNLISVRVDTIGKQKKNVCMHAVLSQMVPHKKIDYKTAKVFQLCEIIFTKYVV